MRSRPSVGFLLLAWLVSLAVPAAAISFIIWTGAALLWPLTALVAAALTVFAGVRRGGGARYAVLIPGLLGSVLAYYGAVVQAAGPMTLLYYGAFALWLLTAGITAATAHRAHD